MDWNLIASKPYGFKTSTLFSILLAGVLINTWVLQEMIFTRQVYHQLFSQQMEAYRIDELVTIARHLSWWNYILAPVFIALRLLLVALILQMPLVLRFVDLPFARLYHIVTVAFFVMLTMMLVKTGWLASLPAVAITERTLALMPLSLTSVVNPYRFSPRVLGFLGNFSLFELIWCTLVVLGLRVEARLKWLDAILVTTGVWTAILVLQFIFMLYFNEVQR